MFTFPLDPSELLAERASQMQGWGVPAPAIAAVRKVITDCWHDGPGGWAHEWVRRASVAEQAGRHLEAASLYGAAKFPVLCTQARQQALRAQIRAYLAAAPRFPCRFERLQVRVAYRGARIAVPVHVFERRGASHARPLVCLSGGVDTLKMELHRVAMALALAGGFRVAVMDLPGTGESTVALANDCDAIYRGVIGQLNTHGVKTAMVGISFGGHWAAKLALGAHVDAAVNIGGPAGFGATFPAPLTALPNGMTGIVANALGLHRMPGHAEAAALLSAFALPRQALEELRCPLLVINGDQDPYLPREDTTGFEGAPGARVLLVKGATHCATQHSARIVGAAVAWLRVQLYGASYVNSALYAVSDALLPALSHLPARR